MAGRANEVCIPIDDLLKIHPPVTHQVRIHLVNVDTVAAVMKKTGLKLVGSNGHLDPRFLRHLQPHVQAHLNGLAPTSIVVVPDPTYGKGSTSGHPASYEGGVLKPHTANPHARTVLKVWTETDQIEYICDAPFEIARVDKVNDWYKEKHVPVVEASKDFPFHQKLPESRSKGTQHHLLTSTLRWEANDKQYKMTFKIAQSQTETTVDPDYYCGFPPFP
jgi:hypothetical protein